MYPLVPARGDGLVIEDVDGNRFLDFNAGIAVASDRPLPSAAWSRPSSARVTRSCTTARATGTSRRTSSCASGSPIARPPEWATTRTFLANSGTEAVEGALKLARQHTGRPNVIAFHGAFHGRSLGSLALTASKARYRSGFGAMMPGVFHAPYGESGAIERTIFTHLTPPSDVAAIFVEPIQGEGGYVIPPPGWLAEFRTLCDEHGILLVADEVQSGVGRTGRTWAVDHERIAPDLLLVGKGIASGLPLAAIVAPRRDHAVGGRRARLDVRRQPGGVRRRTRDARPRRARRLQETMPLAHNARNVGTHLLEGLERMSDGHPSVHGVHGRGLMIGVDFRDHDTAYAVEQEAFRHGLLVLTCGVQTLRLAPPLVVTGEQADRAVAILDVAIAEVERTGR